MHGWIEKWNNKPKFNSYSQNKFPYLLTNILILHVLAFKWIDFEWLPRLCFFRCNKIVVHLSFCSSFRRWWWCFFSAVVVVEVVIAAAAVLRCMDLTRVWLVSFVSCNYMRSLPRTFCHAFALPRNVRQCETMPSIHISFFFSLQCNVLAVESVGPSFDTYRVLFAKNWNKNYTSISSLPILNIVFWSFRFSRIRVIKKT